MLATHAEHKVSEDAAGKNNIRLGSTWQKSNTKNTLDVTALLDATAAAWPLDYTFPRHTARRVKENIIQSPKPDRPHCMAGITLAS